MVGCPSRFGLIHMRVSGHEGEPQVLCLDPTTFRPALSP